MGGSLHGVDLEVRVGEAPWMERIYPFHRYIGAEPLTTGVDWSGLGLLAAPAVLAAAGSAAAFDRRDLMA